MNGLNSQPAVAASATVQGVSSPVAQSNDPNDRVQIVAYTEDEERALLKQLLDTQRSRQVPVLALQPAFWREVIAKLESLTPPWRNTSEGTLQAVVLAWHWHWTQFCRLARTPSFTLNSDGVLQADEQTWQRNLSRDRPDLLWLKTYPLQYRKELDELFGFCAPQRQSSRAPNVVTAGLPALPGATQSPASSITPGSPASVVPARRSLEDPAPSEREKRRQQDSEPAAAYITLRPSSFRRLLD